LHVRRELCRIEVAVGVDPRWHGRMMPHENTARGGRRSSWLFVTGAHAKVGAGPAPMQTGAKRDTVRFRSVFRRFSPWFS
jgi:hypothetical protein